MTCVAEGWNAVAASGTDPALLSAVTTCLAVDPAGFHRRLRAERRADHADALRAAARAVPADPDGEADRARAAWAGLDVSVALPGDPAYPARLAHDPDAPPLLAWRGAPPGERDGLAVAIVGTRRASGYGRGVAAWLAEAVAEAGVHVVSGGAVGIDAAAHESAYAQRGATSVVLGCGHAFAYPRPHAAPGGLFDRIVAHGGTLLSESLPDDAPRPPRVRARNRIVAGLVDAVVVVEGGERSGALITASAAADRGIPVLAVPGDVRAPRSVAPHRLLGEGAAVCTSPADLFDALGTVTPGERTSDGGDQAVPALRDNVPETAGLPAPVAGVLRQRWPRPVDLEQLAREAEMPTGALLATVTRARVAGIVAVGPEGVRLRRAPGPAP